MGNPYIDYRFVKENSDVSTILDALGITGKVSGDEIRINCIDPNHNDERASCDVNTKKRTYYCHSCGTTGSILDLVAIKQDLDLRDAAVEVATICQIALSARSKNSSQFKRKAVRSNGHQTPAPKIEAVAEPAEPDLPFSPFSTKLKLNTEHQFGVDRGLTDKLIAQFEMGFQDRGMFADRWCIPIHDKDGNQLGYTGRWAKKTVPKDIEKWMFPKKFPKQEVLFNAHRVNPYMEDHGVILVEGALDTICLHSQEYPVLGLLGTSISEQQIEILLGLEVEFVLVMLDGDAPGRKAVPALLEQLSREFYVRDLKLPDGEDPETLSRDFLRENVWGL